MTKAETELRRDGTLIHSMSTEPGPVIQHRESRETEELSRLQSSVDLSVDMRSFSSSTSSSSEGSDCSSSSSYSSSSSSSSDDESRSEKKYASKYSLIEKVMN